MCDEFCQFVELLKKRMILIFWWCSAGALCTPLLFSGEGGRSPGEVKSEAVINHTFALKVAVEWFQ